MAQFDILVVGGGVNGCGIARDAAGRGASVCLVEKGDLAGATSSASTKLIHGGLRYLEYYEFRLVREALEEREVLLAAAPHIIRPLRFVLPHHRGLRPAWMLRLGLFLYDHLGGRKHLPATKTVALAQSPLGAGLKPDFRRGFEYSDCTVDDARLVVLNARDAADRGAAVLTHIECIAAERRDGLWHAALRDLRSGEVSHVTAKALVAAAGPWVTDFLAKALRRSTETKVRLVKGSHIVVPRLFADDRAFIFQNADGRIVFAIPYEGDFTLIGTTDLDFDGDPATVKITEDEIDYLCAAVSEYLEKPVMPSDIVWPYSGVRPLYDDGVSEAKAATRDYVLELDAGEGAPLLTVFGGKITTYRRLAEQALEKLAPHLDALRKTKGWTAGAPLPGGGFPPESFDDQAAQLLRAYPFLSKAHARRLVHAYGTEATVLLGEARSEADLGRVFGADLTEAEVIHLMDREWALTAEDVLWRRSKLGLRLSAEERAALEAFMAERSDPGLSTAAQ